MFTQFFGQFLLNQDLIKPEELKEVFKNVKTTRLRLGMIAINEGFLNANQVIKINELQKKHDRRFGEIAVEFMYITNDELDIILNKQQSEHLILAQTMVNLEYMTIEEFEKAIEMYKKLYNISNESFEELKNGKIEDVIYSMLKIDDNDIKDYVTLFYKNIIRFISDEVYISESTKLESNEKYKFLFEQNIRDDKNLYTAYTASRDVLISFAEKYSKEKIETIDEYTLDVCKEFLNLHNGLFAVNMSDKNIKIRLNIQSCKENYILGGKDLYMIPFHTNIGEIKLIVG
ncbi:hypothetical protein [Helicovermis profundi]|uniref:Uncharacterized protein n=1 Tax=Helicovermis profundi TaxID=3065157 RepID=A0AAU9EBE2_9FIRM|nr:hypothetical protein HLPR_15780 [Clostridia bacterium S502]